MKQVLKVVKIGGKIIDDEKMLQDFLIDFSSLQGPKVLVHGGGIVATGIAEKLGYQTRMVDGRRITDPDSMKVITMTYAGLINKDLVARLQGLGNNAAGLCGADGLSIISKQREVREIDYGLVGDVEQVNTGLIKSLLAQGISPVFSAISCTREGQLLNTNGDSVATELARELGKEYDTQLFFCFEKNGVLRDAGDDQSVIENLDTGTYRALLDQGVITAGMLPKLQNCFRALGDVSEIFLGNASLLQDKTIRTKITG